MKLFNPLLLLLLSSLLSGLAHAAPSNDNLGAAYQINQLTFNYTQSVREATVENNETRPSCAGDRVGGSVWFRYTSVNAQTLIVDTSGSDYDTVVSVWESGNHPLTEIACGDDNAGQSQAQVTFQAQASGTYLIKVSALPADSGNNLVFKLARISPLANDELINATVISPATNINYQQIQTTEGATVAANDPVPSCNPDAGANVWYRYTAERNQVLAIDTAGSNYDTVLSVWSGGSSLTEIACNDDDGDNVQAQVRAELTAGRTYWIQVAGVNLPPPDTGALTLRITTPINNDTIATARTIQTPLPYTATFSTSGTLSEAELQPSCVDQVDQVGSDVWFVYTPDTDQSNLRVSTLESDYNTVLAVWQDDGNEISEVACNDDFNVFSFSEVTSLITTSFTAGTRYYVQIAGAMGATGNVNFSFGEAGELDFVLTKHPQSQTIAAGATVTLVVDLGPRGTGLPVATPVDYQWYQGDKGDTSTPVGTNQDTFTPPALQSTTQYWVKVSNGTGSRNSNAATITVTGGTPIDPPEEPTIPVIDPNDPTAPLEPPPVEQRNGLGVNTDLEVIATDSHFIGYLIRQSDKRIVSEVAENETVKLGFVANVDSNHRGQQGDVVIVGVYKTADFEGVYAFDGAAGEWIVWDITLEGLPAMQTDVTLNANISLPLFEGELVGLSGDFTFFMGYVVKETGSLFFGSEPLVFTVQAVD